MMVASYSTAWTRLWKIYLSSDDYAAYLDTERKKFDEKRLEVSVLKSGDIN